MIACVADFLNVCVFFFLAFEGVYLYECIKNNMLSQKHKAQLIAQQNALTFYFVYKQKFSIQTVIKVTVKNKSFYVTGSGCKQKVMTFHVIW